MTAQEIRQRYLDYFKDRNHQLINRGQLVPQDDPTTLFTGSGMQPLLPYLLGESHPAGQRLVNSQPCLRAQDIDEVGDNRHTTGFEMLGNWSLGDYFKNDQLNWFFDFLVKELGLDPRKIYVTCFIGQPDLAIPADQEAAKIFEDIYRRYQIEAKVVSLGSAANGDRQGLAGGRIFYYDDKENWWSRGGGIEQTPIGDPAGGDCEFFYDFGPKYHDQAKFGQAHPASDSGRFLEIGNSVFMEYRRQPDGSFQPLARKNVDFGGGLERLAAAVANEPDVFKSSLLWPLVSKIETLCGQTYQEQFLAMRIIADHFRAASWLVVDGVQPSNKEQGYVLRRLLRRSLRWALNLGIEGDLGEQLTPVIGQIYGDDYPEFKDLEKLAGVFLKEEATFRKTLKSGLANFKKITLDGHLDGPGLFQLYDTYGFPVELSLEEAQKQAVKLAPEAQAQFADLMKAQKDRSRAAVTAGQFKGGLADHQPMTVKHHTATHLLYRALRNILGEKVSQRGSNVTADRLRFDFSYDQRLESEQLTAVEAMVNQQIEKDWPISWRLEKTDQALASGVIGAFGDKYGPEIKVYTVGDPDGDHYSREICGGPHVERTGQLAEDDRYFKILKQESSSAGVRRIKAALVAGQ